jgi:diacylglycerol kinase (ATP)
METRRFNLRARMASFRFAGRGLVDLVAREHNARIHLLASLAVVAGGVWLHVTRAEWALLAGAMALVWTAAALNTAVERLADAVAPDADARIGHVKDLAAAGVLASAIGAAVIGLLVFVPRLYGWLLD